VGLPSIIWELPSFIGTGVFGMLFVPIGAQADNIKVKVNNEKISTFLMLIDPLERWNEW
jgi:hypothetical protein